MTSSNQKASQAQNGKKAEVETITSINSQSLEGNHTMTTKTQETVTSTSVQPDVADKRLLVLSKYGKQKLKKGQTSKRKDITLTFGDGQVFKYAGEPVVQFNESYTYIRVGKVSYGKSLKWENFSFDDETVYADAVTQFKEAIFDESFLVLEQGAVMKKYILSITLFADKAIVISGYDLNSSFLRIPLDENVEWEEQCELLDTLWEAVDDKNAFFYAEGVGAIRYSAFGGLSVVRSGIYVKNRNKNNILWFATETEDERSELLEALQLAFNVSKGKVA